MRLFGFDIKRQKTLTPPASGGGWRTILESYPGAWQQNVEVKAASVLAFSTVNSCVTLIANDIAKLGLRLVERDDDGVWSDVESPVFSPILKRPNNFQNRVQFFQHWVATKLIHGNSYALKERDRRGVVRALYLLDPKLVRPLVAETGEVYYELQTDKLSGLSEPKVVVPATEIIHDRMNTLYHPLVGTSPIIACGLAATQGLRIQNNSVAFFGNGARPSGVLTAPGEIKPETAQRLKETWETNYSGFNSGKVAVLGDGLKYEPMAMSAADAQMIETLKWTSETVANCFHVPFYKVGGPAPSYNNIEALNSQYYSDCLQILIESIEICLDEGLELPGRYGTEFDLDDLLRMDTATMIKAEADAVKAGIKAPNESRRRLNLKPVKGGETPYLQQQNFSLSALADRDADDPFSAPPPVVPAAPTPEEVEEPEEDQTERAIAAMRMKFAEAIYA